MSLYDFSSSKRMRMTRPVCGVSLSSMYCCTIVVSSSSDLSCHVSVSPSVGSVASFVVVSSCLCRCAMMLRQRFLTQVSRNALCYSSRRVTLPSQSRANTSCTASLASLSSPSKMWAALYILPYSEWNSRSNCRSLSCIFCSLFYPIYSRV